MEMNGLSPCTPYLITLNSRGQRIVIFHFPSTQSCSRYSSLGLSFDTFHGFIRYRWSLEVRNPLRCSHPTFSSAPNNARSGTLSGVASSPYSLVLGSRCTQTCQNHGSTGLRFTYVGWKSSSGLSRPRDDPILGDEAVVWGKKTDTEI